MPSPFGVRKRFTQVTRTLGLSADGDSAVTFAEAVALLQGQHFNQFLEYMDNHRNLSNYICPKAGTLLHVAAVMGNTLCVQRLLKLGSNVYVLDSDQWTPLMAAVREQVPIEVVSLLLEAGSHADYHVDGKSIINYAVRGNEGNLPVLKLLLDSLSMEQATECVNILLETSPRYKTVLNNAESPEIRSLLLDYGAQTGEEIFWNVKAETALPRVVENLLSKGYKPKHPCVLLPGTCSSVLECWKSTSKPNWEGTRIWLDPSKLGLKLGLHMKQAEDISYLNHMKLEDDGISDPPGVCVRPAEGIHGLDFLMDSGPRMVIQQSVVWGDFISVFAKLGYTSSNFVGFPYDWRISPEAMNTRDNCFKKLQYTVQYLFETNGEKVALIGHSQGCKFGQYFLHWAEVELGRTWIDKHICDFIALGPPWAGAAKTIRALVSGDSMGLPTSFLFGDKYLVALSRTFSGGPWLLPFGKSQTEFFYSEEGEWVKKHWRENLSELHENFDTFMEKHFKSSPHLFTSEDEEENRSLQAPHVANLHCIYGINSKEVPSYAGEAGTEVGAYFEPRKVPIVIGNKKIAYYQSKFTEERPGERHFVIKGVVKERPLPGNPSGDGTVPYESLAWAQRWKSADGPVIKHYEIEGVPHRETLSDPKVLYLVAEILSGGAPAEICATGEKVDTIFDKSCEFIAEHLSDNDKVPYIISCLLNSLRNTNSVSFHNIGVQLDITEFESNEQLQKFGAIFATWRKPTLPELDKVYPQTRMLLLAKFLDTLDRPLIASEGEKHMVALWERLDQDANANQELLELMQNVMKHANYPVVAPKILLFLHEIDSHPVNGVTSHQIAEQYVHYFFWVLRRSRDHLFTAFSLMLSNAPEIIQ